MRRNTRLILVFATLVLAAGLVGYAVQSIDLAGMVARAHAPPPHGG